MHIFVSSTLGTVGGTVIDAVVSHLGGLSSNPKKNKQGQRRRSKNIKEKAVQQLYYNCPCGWLSKAHNRQICLIDKLSRGLIPRAGKNEQ